MKNARLMYHLARRWISRFRLPRSSVQPPTQLVGLRPANETNYPGGSLLFAASAGGPLSVC